MIIPKTVIVEFGNMDIDSVEALNKWDEVCKQAILKNLNDVRRAFNSVDYIGNDRFA
jgi:hypothetical protein